MALTKYVQYDEVRAALGANGEELVDSVLDLPVYEMGLVRELNKISTSLPAAFSTVNDIGETSRTDLQEALFNASRLFSVYAVARQVGVSLASFLPKDITDGKAAVGRFTGAPYEETMQNVEQMMAVTRADLVTAYAKYAGNDVLVVAPAISFIASQRSTDPVTGV